MDVPGGTLSSPHASDTPHSPHSQSGPDTKPGTSAAIPPSVLTLNSSSAARAGNPSTTSAGHATGFWQSHADQFVLAFVCLVTLGLLVAYWARATRWGAVPIEIDRAKPQTLDFRLDVNSATWVEWTQLEGIGDALARRIVADREIQGPFSSIDDLRRVKGIGPKTLEKIRPWLTIESEASAPDELSPAGSKRAMLTGR
jgi:competence protein ComEA